MQVHIKNTILSPMFCVIATAGHPTIERKVEKENCKGPLDLTTLCATATHVAPYAMSHTTITHVRLPDSVQSIAYGAFSGCKQLRSFHGPGVRVISDRSFSFCTNLSSVHSPNTEHIGNAAFEGCIKIEVFDAPTVLVIGDFAFARCTGLKAARYPCAASAGMHAFALCPSMHTCELGNIDVISHSMCKDAEMLRMFKVPGLVRAIHADAFCGCIALKSVTFGHIPSFISPYAFYCRGRSPSTVLHLLRPIGPEWTPESVSKLQSTTCTLAVVAVRTSNLAVARRTTIVAPYLADAVKAVCLCALRNNCPLLPLELWLFILELAGG